MHAWFKLDFQLFNNSNGIFGTTMVETRFNMYIVIFIALVHKDLGRLELLSIPHIISNNVWFFLSMTPF